MGHKRFPPTCSTSLKPGRIVIPDHWDHPGCGRAVSGEYMQSVGLPIRLDPDAAFPAGDMDNHPGGSPDAKTILVGEPMTGWVAIRGTAHYCPAGLETLDESGME